MPKMRKSGLDVVRTIAIALVIMMHALGLSIDGYAMPISGIDGFFRIYIRRLCFACVPLFLMLSGYLNIGKNDALKIWKKSFPKLYGTYFLWAVLSIVFDMFFFGNALTIDSVTGIFNYTCFGGRAWYMNMYLGLLVIMPFVNKGWKVLMDKEKLICLISLFVLSFGSQYISKLSGNGIVLISSNFYNLSYIFYYLFGAYVAEEEIKIKKQILLVGWQLILLGHTLYYYIAGQNMLYNEIPGAASFWYDNMFLAVEAMLMFLLLHDLQINKDNINRKFSTISVLAFDMYLCSYFFDMYINKKFNFLYYKYPFWIVLLLCFTLSFLLSTLVARAKWGMGSIFRKEIKK